MNEALESADDPSEAEMLKLASLLTRADIWVDPPGGIEDSIVVAIGEEARATLQASANTRGSGVTHLATRRRADPYVRWLSAAAATVLVVGGIALIAREDEPPVEGATFVLGGTAAAPDATALVNLSSTPAGLKILFDAEGLGAAPPGYFYEAWLSDGSLGVSAGTFHLRGSDGEIELWAGVTDPEFSRMTVTLEPLDGVTDSSGDVRLVGVFQLAGG